MTVPDAPGPGTVAVIGTGVIGASWTALFLAHGHDVVASDPADGAHDRLLGSLDLSVPVARRVHDLADRPTGQLHFVADARDAAEAGDFVQENASERLEDKQCLVAALDEAARDGVVVASSSSGLTPSVIQEACRRDPGRVVVGHPFDPPHLIPLVEVVAGERTRGDATDRACAFYRSVGKRPVVVRREVPGHLANRLQAALWREAYSLVATGVASVEDVDTVLSSGPALRWAQAGPFINLHLSGGPGGMAHMHAHLGPTMEALWADFSTPALTPELVETINRQVVDLEAHLGGPARVRGEREELIVELLRHQDRLRRPDDTSDKEDD